MSRVTKPNDPKKEIERLRDELAESAKAISERENIISEREKRILEMGAMIAHLQDYNRRLLHWRFGHRTEKLEEPGQQILEEFAEALKANAPAATDQSDNDEAENEISSRPAPKKKGGRRLWSEIAPHLPIDETIIGLEPDECFDADGRPLVVTGRETKEELVFDPATARIRRIVRLRYGRADTGEKVITPPPPERIVPKGSLSDETLLAIVIMHTIDCLPFNRIAEIMRRAGAPVDRNLITQNFHAFCAFAEPLLAAMETELLEADLLHVDGSFMFRQDGRRRRRCTRSPVYAISDGEQVLFRWRKDERHDTAADLIDGYNGYLVRDEWDGWYGLKADVTHIGCNAHARRYFAQNQDDVDARAMVRLYAKMYAVERAAGESGLRGVALEEHRRDLRQRHSIAVMDQIHALAETIAETRTGKMASSARYIIKHRIELRRFLDNGSLPPDNNLAERVLRRHPMLRNNRRFFVAENGGVNLATALSLTGSCRLLDLHPMTYLQATLPALYEYRRAKKLGLALPDLRLWTPAAYGRRLNQAMAA